jgi:hypothetical protein
MTSRTRVGTPRSICEASLLVVLRATELQSIGVRDGRERPAISAGSSLDITEVLVIGSQAAHGSISAELPPEAIRSIEVDIAAFQDSD